MADPGIAPFLRSSKSASCNAQRRDRLIDCWQEYHLAAPSGQPITGEHRSATTTGVEAAAERLEEPGTRFSCVTGREAQQYRRNVPRPSMSIGFQRLLQVRRRLRP